MKRVKVMSSPLATKLMISISVGCLSNMNKWALKWAHFSIKYQSVTKLFNLSRLFEMVVKYFDAFLNLIPLSFVLGFYVSYVASRWWQQFLAIPWPDKLFHSIACFVEGFDEDSRMLRRSLMRYMNLALILVLRSISSAVKQRFPTLEHVVEAGFMTNQEKELFQVRCDACLWTLISIHFSRLSLATNSTRTGFLAPGLSTDCKKPPKKASYWTSTRWKPSCENFANSGPSVVYYGATIGSPSPWSTPKSWHWPRTCSSSSRWLAGRRSIPSKRASTCGPAACPWTSTCTFQFIPSFNSSSTWVCSRYEFNSISTPEIEGSHTLDG